MVILHEKIALKEWVGIALIIVAAVLLSVYAKPEASTLNLTYLLELMVIVIIVGVILMVLALVYFKQQWEYFLGITAGMFFGMGSLFNKGIYSSGIPAFNSIIVIASFTLSRVIMAAGWGIFYLIAFLNGQSALFRGRMNISSVLSNVFSILITIIGEVLLFGDQLIIPASETSGVFLGSYFNIIGFILILIGVILCYKKPILHPTVENPPQ